MAKIKKTAACEVDRCRNRTRKVLAESLISLLEKKEFQKITVNDICATSEVSRPTFYTYFRDKDSLLRFCIGDLYEKAMDEATVNGGSGRDIITHILGRLEKHRQVVRNLLQGQDVNDSSEIFNQVFFKRGLDTIANMEANCTGAVPKEMTAVFRAGGSLLVMIWWLNNSSKLSKDEVIDYLLLLNGSEAVAIDN